MSSVVEFVTVEWDKVAILTTFVVYCVSDYNCV